MKKGKIVGIVLLLLAIVMGTIVFPKFKTVAYESTSDLANYPKDALVMSGISEGYKSDIAVDVIVKDGEILDVVITKHAETGSFFEKSTELIDNIVNQQTSNVDVISGATKSSQGIISAVENALAN